MAGWVDEVVRRHEGRPWTNLHDEGIFTRTFPAFYVVSGHAPALEYSEKLADEFLASPVAEACTCFLTKEDAAQYGENELVGKYHGYQADQSCLVHGPENYCWFLTHLAQVSENPKYAAALADCAEHIGNFSADCPPWYDWDNHRFRSALLGTKLVRDYPPYDYETLTHVRVMVLASNAFALTGDQRYLDLAVNWCDKWAEVVLSSENGFPVALFPVSDDRVTEVYGEFANRSRTTVQYELAHLLLDICRISPCDRYAAAVRKMISGSIDKNDWAMGNLLAKYRCVTSDESFDQDALHIADESLRFDDDLPALIAVIDREGRTGFTDVDYVRVGADSSAVKDRRSVGMLACAWQISGDARYAESAMKLAWMRFWASWYLWDGRELGCRGSWSGRNGIAMHNVIPALNVPAAGGFGMLEGELPWFELYYRRPDGKPGLPDRVAALYRGDTLLLANVNEEPTYLQLVCGGRRISLPQRKDGAVVWTRIDLPANSLTTVGLADS